MSHSIFAQNTKVYSKTQTCYISWPNLKFVLWDHFGFSRIEVLRTEANKLQDFHDVREQNTIQLRTFGELSLALVDDGDSHLSVVVWIHAL